MSKLFLPSTTEGKTWSIGFIKYPKRPAYWSATEGEVEHSEYEGVKFTTFKFTLFQARQRRKFIEGPATAKKKDAALADLIDSLRIEGLIKEAA